MGNYSKKKTAIFNVQIVFSRWTENTILPILHAIHLIFKPEYQLPELLFTSKNYHSLLTERENCPKEVLKQQSLNSSVSVCL